MSDSEEPWQNIKVQADLRLGDCIDLMKTLPEASIDAVITDPPYGLEFMGRDWDKPADLMATRDAHTDSSIGRTNDPFIGARVNRYFAGKQFQDWCGIWAKQALRVLKPGGFMFTMGGTRTHHRLTCGIEDAGFNIRDELCWVYLQGFPKAQDLSILVERKLGGEGEDTGIRNPVERPNTKTDLYDSGKVGKEVTYKLPTLPQAKRWIGWKTPALKPAFEPIIVAQKPCEGSITENVIKYGVGGFNIEGCRIPFESEEDAAEVDFNRRGTAERSTKSEGENMNIHEGGWKARKEVSDLPSGRYPSNLLMQEECFGKLSHFFIIPKASKGEKNEDLAEFEEREVYRAGHGNKEDDEVTARFRTNAKNIHPTVKPVGLMQHLIKLVTKPQMLVLDPFLGSGTTAVAALKLNRNVIGLEINTEYLAIAKARVAEETKQTRLEEESEDEEF